MKAIFSSEQIWTDKRFPYIYNMPSYFDIYTDKDAGDVIDGWRTTYYWLKEHESVVNEAQTRIFILQKIVSSVLHYARYYVWKRNDKNSLLLELENLDVIELMSKRRI